MRRFEVRFPSLNTEYYSKEITALVIAPDEINPETGAALFSHGWSGNRFQHQEHMEETAERYNLVCISTEYRQSGYDFDQITGSGSYVPYDASFYQVIDCLGALRHILETYQLDGSRIYHYGGSQGGHICLLSSIFAPNTFAGIYASRPITYLDDHKIGWSGRTFVPYELKVRDVALHAERINCPIFLEHGTGDTTVDCEIHTKALVAKLRALGKEVTVRYYEGGEHNLAPAITILEAYRILAPELFQCRKENAEHDFMLNSKIIIPCGERTLELDWSKAQTDPALLRWV